MGHGKIEALNRLIRRAFLAVLKASGITTLDTLNEAFWAWADSTTYSVASLAVAERLEKLRHSLVDETERRTRPVDGLESPSPWLPRGIRKNAVLMTSKPVVLLGSADRTPNESLSCWWVQSVLLVVSGGADDISAPEVVMWGCTCADKKRGRPHSAYAPNPLTLGAQRDP